MSRPISNLVLFALLLHLAAWIAATGLTIGIENPHLPMMPIRNTVHFLFFGVETTKSLHIAILVATLAARVLTFIVLLVWVITTLRAKRRQQSGLCPICGYDLRASPTRCPECGTPISGDDAPVGKSPV